jgi:hypothetical protein
MACPALAFLCEGLKNLDFRQGIPLQNLVLFVMVFFKQAIICKPFLAPEALSELNWQMP